MSAEALKAKLAAARMAKFTQPAIGITPAGEKVVAAIQTTITTNPPEVKQDLVDLTQIKQDTTAIPDAQDKELSELENHPLADKVDFIRVKLSDLSAAIELNAPGYKQILLVIDKILRTYKELTYLLNEEEIQVIVQGLIKDSDAQFVVTPASKGGGKGKKQSGKVVKDLDIGGEDDI